MALSTEMRSGAALMRLRFGARCLVWYLCTVSLQHKLIDFRPKNDITRLSLVAVVLGAFWHRSYFSVHERLIGKFWPIRYCIMYDKCIVSILNAHFFVN